MGLNVGELGKAFLAKGLDSQKPKGKANLQVFLNGETESRSRSGQERRTLGETIKIRQNPFCDKIIKIIIWRKGVREYNINII